MLTGAMAGFRGNPRVQAPLDVYAADMAALLGSFLVVNISQAERLKLKRRTGEALLNQMAAIGYAMSLAAIAARTSNCALLETRTGGPANSVRRALSGRTPIDAFRESGDLSAAGAVAARLVSELATRLKAKKYGPHDVLVLTGLMPRLLQVSGEEAATFLGVSHYWDLLDR
jgi:hypothetical protein